MIIIIYSMQLPNPYELACAKFIVDVPVKREEENKKV